MLGDPFASVAARESEELLGQEELCNRRALLRSSAPGCAHEGGRERQVCVCVRGDQSHKQTQLHPGGNFVSG